MTPCSLAQMSGRLPHVAGGPASTCFVNEPVAEALWWTLSCFERGVARLCCDLWVLSASLCLVLGLRPSFVNRLEETHCAASVRTTASV